MNASSKIDPAALEALRESAPVAPTWGEASHQVWVGGRVFENVFGEKIFLPLGKSRKDIGVLYGCRFLGDGVKNIVGYGGEVRVTNPVGGAV